MLKCTKIKSKGVDRKLDYFDRSCNSNPQAHRNYVQDINSLYKIFDYSEKELPTMTKKYVSFGEFLQIELTRGYQLEHEEQRFSARREKIYSFFKIPREVEKFMIYGFFQCADSFLYVYTFLPLRFIMAVWAIIIRRVKQFIGKKQCCKQKKEYLTSAEICDLLKGIVVFSCWIITWKVDTSMMYHLVKSQSVIKLYIFYNMLEVGDRLFSAFGQDTIDALLWTATEPRSKIRSMHSQHLGTLPHLFFAVVYVLLHSILVLFQATTLNVAINSSNKALLTIMMSNNVKHAFITRFNELCSIVYREYTVSLAYDMAQTRQETACSDPSDLVARRMGFIPLPLSVAIARVLCSTLTPSAKPMNILLIILAYLILTTLRIFINLMILGPACDLISLHPQSTLIKHEINKKNKGNNDWKNTLSENENISTELLSNSSSRSNNKFLTQTMLLKSYEQLDTNFTLECTQFQRLDNFPSLPTTLVRAGSEPLLLSQ
ncbi:transmembrane anterior posterior transformation protein 1 homolog isoform X2 [Phymastichus coffea]|uniref:transmembrane anterior posterior transformation protein 1 homolog isoform X2 n=1 Tax=Phymastichus coffea TaxID=108790 RepID=UPI00273B0F90|nr:transmembrane anterior posterior transformation protein 1 homolog isoform X2 [Phymastichus coffea]